MASTSARAQYAESAMRLTTVRAFTPSLIGIALASSVARADNMPEIARFNGIVITMYFEEHGRPHFHARLGEFRISVEIDESFVRGQFPGPALRQVLDWVELHRAELTENWQRARLGEPVLPIEPLR